MKKRYIVLVAILLIQLIRLPKNEHERTETSMYEAYDVPERTAQLLERSCNDCYSGKTKYLWYHEFAPLSWGVWLHIKQGKDHLNFDKWTTYNTYQKQTIFDHLHEVLEEHKMPIAGYLLFHKEARLSEEDTRLLLDWFEILMKKELKSGKDE